MSPGANSDAAVFSDIRRPEHLTTRAVRSVTTSNRDLAQSLLTRSDGQGYPSWSCSLAAGGNPN